MPAACIHLRVSHWDVADLCPVTREQILWQTDPSLAHSLSPEALRLKSGNAGKSILESAHRNGDGVCVGSHGSPGSTSCTGHMGSAFPAPQAEGNEASLGNWVNSWAKQAAGGAQGCCNKGQP